MTLGFILPLTTSQWGRTMVLIIVIPLRHLVQFHKYAQSILNVPGPGVTHTLRVWWTKQIVIQIVITMGGRQGAIDTWDTWDVSCLGVQATCFSRDI